MAVATPITGSGNIGITINQSNITDRALNTLTETAARVSAVFSIDNDAPIANTVVAAPALVNLSTIGNGTFTITTVFNEDMNIGVPPTITFPVENPATAITFNSGSWALDNRTYTATYNVANAVVLILNDVDIRVTGAKDLFGNVMVQKDKADEFDVNLNAPTLTTVSIASNNVNGGPNPTWAKVGNTVTLEIVGSVDLATPVVTIAGHTTLDGVTISDKGDADAKTWNATYTMLGTDNTGTIPFTINFQDLAGNVGSQVTAINSGSNVTFDKTLPVVAIASPAAAFRTNGSHSITFGVTEANPAANTQVKIGVGGTPTNVAGTSIQISAINAGDWAAVADETDFTVYVTHTDLAGNSHTDSRQFRKDITLPTVVSITPNFGTKAGTYYAQVAGGERKLINRADINGEVYFETVFSEAMNQSTTPTLTFGDALGGALTTAGTVGVSGWQNPTTYRTYYKVADAAISFVDVDLTASVATDLSANAINVCK